MKDIKEYIFEKLNYKFSASEYFNKCETLYPINRNKSLFLYLDRLLSEIYTKEKKGDFPFHHIHIEYPDDYQECEEFQTNITEFILLWLYIRHIKNDKSDTEIDSFINKLPNGKSALDLGKVEKKKEIKKAQAEFHRKKQTRKFYEKWKMENGNATFQPNSMLIANPNISKHLEETWSSSKYISLLDTVRQEPSYIVMNSEHQLNALRRNKDKGEILEHIREWILIGYNSRLRNKSLWSSYNYNQLSTLNGQRNYRFNRAFSLTFAKQDHLYFGSLIRSLDNIKTSIYQKKVNKPCDITYLIPVEEIRSILREHENSVTEKRLYPEIIFHQDNKYADELWDNYEKECEKHLNLYELRSNKLRNLYSYAINKNMQDYIISDIFDNDESTLISPITKELINEMESSERDALKQSLRNYWETTCSEWSEFLRENTQDASYIIISPIMHRNETLLRMFDEGLNKSKIEWITWRDYDKCNCNQVIVLDYWDDGKYPFRNSKLHDCLTNTKVKLKALFQSSLFERRFGYSRYERVRYAYYELLNHPLRHSLFDKEWSDLKGAIKSMKPDKGYTIDWDQEREYGDYNMNDRFEITVVAKDTKKKNTYGGSTKFLSQCDKTESFEILKTTEVNEWFSNEQNEDIYIQPLDELTDIVRNEIETTREKGDITRTLETILEKYGFGEEYHPIKLWKLLLIKKSKQAASIEIFYEELKNYLSDNNANIVSIGSVRSRWLDINSNTLMPREKKTFKYLCKYLELPDIYLNQTWLYYINQNQKETQITRIFYNLLEVLFQIGCFESDANISDLIKSNLRRIENRGNIDSIYAGDDHIAFLQKICEMIRPNINTNKIELIQKIEGNNDKE